MTDVETYKRNESISALIKDGWMQMKQWRHEEAIREGVGEHAIAMRLKRGFRRYYKMKQVAFNRRVIFVKPPE